jgi:hypothetical protein
MSCSEIVQRLYDITLVKKTQTTLHACSILGGTKVFFNIQKYLGREKLFDIVTKLENVIGFKIFVSLKKYFILIFLS